MAQAVSHQAVQWLRRSVIRPWHGLGGQSSGRAMAQEVSHQAVPWLRRSVIRPWHGSCGQSSGRAMAQEVSHQAAAWLMRSVIRPCHGSGGQSSGRGMAQAVSCRPLTPETRLHSQTSLCGICGGLGVIGTGLLRALRSALSISSTNAPLPFITNIT